MSFGLRQNPWRNRSRNEPVNAITFWMDWCKITRGWAGSLHIDADETVVMMRENMVKRALENLLNNAFRYGDQVSLSLHSDAAFVSSGLMITAISRLINVKMP